MAIRILLIFVSSILAGCATSDVTPLATDMVQVNISAAPVCGQSGSRKLAFKRAAVETINRGYDKFIILNTQTSSESQVVGTTPLYVSGNYIYGGQPIRAGSHNTGVVVKMYRTGQTGSANALDARSQLGPDWENIVKENSVTC